MRCNYVAFPWWNVLKHLNTADVWMIWTRFQCYCYCGATPLLKCARAELLNWLHGIQPMLHVYLSPPLGTRAQLLYVMLSGSGVVRSVPPAAVVHSLCTYLSNAPPRRRAHANSHTTRFHEATTHNIYILLCWLLVLANMHTRQLRSTSTIS